MGQKLTAKQKAAKVEVPDSESCRSRNVARRRSAPRRFSRLSCASSWCWRWESPPSPLWQWVSSIEYEVGESWPLFVCGRFPLYAGWESFALGRRPAPFAVLIGP